MNIDIKNEYRNRYKKLMMNMHYRHNMQILTYTAK